MYIALQFFEYNYKETRWLERPERTYGLANQTTDKVLYVPGYFVSFTEKAASSVNTLIEIYDVNSEKWSSQESEFAKIRAVACCWATTKYAINYTIITNSIAVKSDNFK